MYHCLGYNTNYSHSQSGSFQPYCTYSFGHMFGRYGHFEQSYTCRYGNLFLVHFQHRGHTENQSLYHTCIDNEHDLLPHRQCHHHGLQICKNNRKCIRQSSPHNPNH